MEKYDELYHYGVPGMKWGVRRDRRSNSFKRTVSKKAKAAKIRFQNTTGSRSSNALKAYRKKDINKMSNKDLQTAINRMNLERQYRNLTKRDYMAGNKVVKNILAYAGTATAAYVLYQKYSPAVNEAILAAKYPPKG